MNIVYIQAGFCEYKNVCLKKPICVEIKFDG